MEKKKSEMDHSYRGRVKKKKDKWTWIFNELIEKKIQKFGPLIAGGRKKKDKWTWIFNELNEKKKNNLDEATCSNRSQMNRLVLR